MRREPVWRPVPGARRYDVSDDGRVRDVTTGRALNNPADNRLRNLYYGTAADNVRDRLRNGGADRSRHASIEVSRARSLARARGRAATTNLPTGAGGGAAAERLDR